MVARNLRRSSESVRSLIGNSTVPPQASLQILADSNLDEAPETKPQNWFAVPDYWSQ